MEESLSTEGQNSGPERSALLATILPLICKTRHMQKAPFLSSRNLLPAEGGVSDTNTQLSRVQGRHNECSSGKGLQFGKLKRDTKDMQRIGLGG